MKISQKIAGWMVMSSLLFFTPALWAEDQHEDMKDTTDHKEKVDDDVALAVRVYGGFGPRWGGGWGRGYYYRPYGGYYYGPYRPYYYGPRNFYYYRW